ncbi:MAG: DUF1367 family protein [Serratia marcescens]|uniref:DUF1367 family protein n=1 Tax=Serratia marcescens TaxID=615 RepID=UPI0013DA2976|nr:DUF1367 family protein [Serratia marcescens]MDU3786449.1 DUF1367 family protein [Serratia marcescens]MDU3851374.1 DUF1367 family protein [Serratia marcescens]NSM16905.1 DUF1367 family protein [Serratia marcescens]NSM97171.1 DUF1367 family protein [Serratia marcescens]
MSAAPRTKPSKKHKTEALGVQLPGGGIKYATDHERDTMKGGPTGTPIAMRPVGERQNLKFHRNFWKLQELGFSYWEPDWTFVSDPENWSAHEVAKTLAKLEAESKRIAAQAACDQEFANGQCFNDAHTQAQNAHNLQQMESV